MERTTKKLGGGGEDAYVSGLFWREQDPSLPNSCDMAVQRPESLEEKVKK